MLVLFLHFHQGGFELLPEFQLLVLVDSDFLKGPLKTVFVSLPDNFYFVAKGLPTPESNLWVGMNSTDDAKLELRPVQNNSELWFIKMLMKVDVQIGWNSETVLYI